MSLGPTTHSNNIVEVSRFDRIHRTVKNTTEKYFNNALHYTFYVMLLGTIIGLFFGMKFAWQYYTILVILAVIRGYNHIYLKFKAGTDI